MGTLGWIFVVVLVGVASFLAGAITMAVISLKAAVRHNTEKQKAVREIVEKQIASRQTGSPIAPFPGGEN